MSRVFVELDPVRCDVAFTAGFMWLCETGVSNKRSEGRMRQAIFLCFADRASQYNLSNCPT